MCACRPVELRLNLSGVQGRWAAGGEKVPHADLAPGARGSPSRLAVAQGLGLRTAPVGTGAFKREMSTCWSVKKVVINLCVLSKICRPQGGSYDTW